MVEIMHTHFEAILRQFLTQLTGNRVVAFRNKIE